MNTRILILSAAVAAFATLPACARGPEPAAGSDVATAQVDAGQAAPASADVDGALPHVLVHKTESCGCCGKWVEHMQDAGFHVEVRNVTDMDAIKRRVGIPPMKGSCHTAEIDGYFVEGHVPAEDVKRLLAEKPEARGITVPGMPMGSPGMEMPSGEVDPYAVELVALDGTTSEFARHGN